MAEDPDVDPYLRMVRERIECLGWVVQAVDAADGRPGLSYTVGLWPATGLELVVAGLPAERALKVLNDLGHRVLDGARYEHGRTLDDVLPDRPVTVLDVPDPGDHLALANRLYALDGPVRAQQVVVPDDDLLWPWDPRSAVRGTPLLGPPPHA